MWMAGPTPRASDSLGRGMCPFSGPRMHISSKCQGIASGSGLGITDGAISQVTCHRVDLHL